MYNFQSIPFFLACTRDGNASLEQNKMGCTVMRVFVMCVCTPLRPCQLGPAPAPPAIVSTSTPSSMLGLTYTCY